jgi:hypothetical protein
MKLEYWSDALKNPTLQYSFTPIARPEVVRDIDMKKADFRQFYRDAHAVECLTDREKMLIGLAVAVVRLCDP